eukprot:2294098-Amphidinium_carterae.1
MPGFVIPRFFCLNAISDLGWDWVWMCSKTNSRPRAWTDSIARPWSEDDTQASLRSRKEGEHGVGDPRSLRSARHGGRCCLEEAGRGQDHELAALFASAAKL